MHQAGPRREGLQIRFLSARLNPNSQACNWMVFVLSVPLPGMSGEVF